MRVQGKAGVVAALGVVVALVTAMSASAAPAPEPGPPPATDLVLLLDGSGSIDAADWRLQLDGYAAALRDQVNFPLDGSKAVSVVQWSYSGVQPAARTEVPLTVLDDRAAVDGLVAKVLAIAQIGAATNPGDAVRTGTDELVANGRDGADWALCMSTDGTRNSGEALESARQHALASGVDRYSVVAIEDPGFTAELARSAYGPFVFGGGAVTVARSTTEFTSLISGCAGKPMRLRALEVNQSVQDWDNSLPLVESKPTVVRAFLETRDGRQARTNGQLRGFRFGAELPGSPLTPLNPAPGVLVDGTSDGDRSALADSLNFVLPMAWLQQGGLQLSLELPGGVYCEDATGAETSCQESVVFDDAWALDVEYRGLEWEQDGADTGASFADLSEQHERTIGMFPTSGWRAGFSTLRVDERPDSLSEVNERLNTARIVARAPAEQRWYGVIQDGTADLGGLASGRVSSGWTAGVNEVLETGHARNRAPHEIGHSTGLHHSVNAAQNGTDEVLWFIDVAKRGWCGEVSATDAPDYPHWLDTADGDRVAALGPVGDPQTEVWGLDTRLVGRSDALAVSAPQSTFSLMSYCVGDAGTQGRWIGKRDYEQMHDGDRDPISDEPDAAATDNLVLRGTVRADGQVAQLAPALVAQLAPTPSDPAGTHELVLLDAAGGVLQTTRFTPEGSEAEPAPGQVDVAAQDAVFAVVLPGATPGLARVELRRAGQPGPAVTAVTASPSAPTVRVPAPSTGTAGRVTLSWTSADPDGAALRHAVLYSPDDGASWDVVALDVTGSSVSVPRRSLPGSATARVRVVATDGLRATAATSPRFSLPDLAPRVALQSPGEGARFTAAQTIPFTASADDAEDGTLDGASVQWSSDRDGVLGTGARLERRADTLSEGTHVITVRATDSAGGTTTQTVRIAVSRLATPPPPPPSTFSFGGFTPPVSGTTENLATAGRTLPVKFSVVGAGVVDSTVLEAGFVADGATYALVRSGSTWHVNAQTPRQWAGTTGTFRVRLSDGTVHEAPFRFR